MSEMHSNQVGPISSSSRLLSPQQKAWWGRTKADPSGNSYKKHPKNTQQALARSLHLPSLKLTAKESPGGRKFGLCPTCKCAVWGAVGGRKSHKQALWIQRKPTQTASNSEPLKRAGAWLDYINGYQERSLLQVISNRIATVSFPWAVLRKQKLLYLKKKKQQKVILKYLKSLWKMKQSKISQLAT